MKILAIVSGEYGKRHVENIQKNGPHSWKINIWQAPAIFPMIIDEPEDFLPPAMQPADLILSFAEHKGMAELLPEIARRTGAQAVIVAVDNETWLPRGLATQLRGWLAEMNVACATPKPLCTLTESDYKTTRSQRESYHSPQISEFARYFRQPELTIEVDPENETIASIEVRRDATCGCARYVAQRLVGLSTSQVEEKADLLHHHYPCLASMVKLDDYGHETLMMESGDMLKASIRRNLTDSRSRR